MQIITILPPAVYINPQERRAGERPLGRRRRDAERVGRHRAVRRRASRSDQLRCTHAAYMPTPHQLGVHHVLKRLRPLLHPLFDGPSQRRLGRAVNIDDLRTCASQRAHRMVFDYLDGGAEDEIAFRWSREAFARYELHYHVLAGAAPPLDMRTSLFGVELGRPYFCTPTAGHRMFHHEGEAAVAAAAAAHDTLFCLSALATTSVEEVAAHHPGPKLMQFYLWKDRALVRDVVQRAKESGYAAIALTADTAWFGNRERDLRNGFSVPVNYTARQVWQALNAPSWSLDFLSHEPYAYAVVANDRPAEEISSYFSNMMSKDYSWADAEWLLSEWGGPAALKGVVRADDAVRARDAGFSTIWISNHGGRQLETSPAPLDVLPAIRAALGPEAEIVIDGGIQRGTDIAKALALGANGVGLGKAYLYGLAAGGAPGVRKALDILGTETERAMGLLGVASVEELRRRGPDLVRRRTPT